MQSSHPALGDDLRISLYSFTPYFLIHDFEAAK